MTKIKPVPESQSYRQWRTYEKPGPVTITNLADHPVYGRNGTNPSKLA